MNDMPQVFRKPYLGYIAKLKVNDESIINAMAAWVWDLWVL